MKGFICFILIVGLLIYLIFASETFQVHTSTEWRNGVEYKVNRFEWHWANLFSYLRDLPRRLYAKGKCLIHNLEEKFF